MSELDRVDYALGVAEKAMKEVEHFQDMVKATVNMTIELAKFTKDKLDEAIIYSAAGNNVKTAFILADLRIRFDELIKKNTGFPDEVRKRE